MAETALVADVDARHASADAGVSTGADARPLRGGVLRVLGLAAILCAIGAALLVHGRDWLTEPALAAPWWVAILIGVGFALAERFVFTIEYRREAIMISLSEVPTAFALAFLAPVVAIPLRILTGVGLMVVRYRPKPFKAVFNAALVVFEATLAFSIVRWFVSTEEFVGGHFLVAAAAAMTLASFGGVAAVSIAVASFEGRLVRRLVGEARTALVVGPAGALIASVAVAPALFGIGYAALSIVPIVAVWLVLLRYGVLVQRHRDLSAVHEFSAVVGESLDVEEVATVAIGEVRRLLRAEGAALHVFRRDGSPLTAIRSGVPVGPAEPVPDASGWGAALGSDSASWCSVDEDGELRPTLERPTDHLIVSLGSGGSITGVLLVVRRAGLTGLFDRSDLQRADTLGAQLSIALDKALLHADMEHAAMHDALTGDPNRATFDRAVTDALVERSGYERGVLAVLMLDLDQFKEVNDTLGHHVGDRVLVEFAARMRTLIEPDDVFARFGGDEFALFVCRPDVAAVRQLADRVLSAAHAPLALDGYDIVVTVSVGAAVSTDDDRDAAALVRRADIAMYAAKHDHLGFELYREEIDRRTPQRLAMLGDLREVLDAGGIEIHVQPKLDLASSTVVGAEALARWHHPTRGWVAPDEFIRVAEDTGLIRRLTDQVLSMSVQLARSWHDAGHDLTISVNLSTLDLLDELLPERIAGRLEQHGVAADRLILEITESSLMADTPRTMSTVDRLHRLGVGLSLDDFGTGYSSLSYLRQLPVSEIKIDRSFVANLALDAQDEVIVRSTIELGHNLGLRVVAEGVEDASILERLQVLGCDLGQGYGIGRPLAPALFDRWLATAPFQVATTRWASARCDVVGA
jgi:diguanylate cyclase (GGDEF)-like protein